MWIHTKNPAGGLGGGGGAVSPPGVRAVAQQFLKFLVSVSSDDLFWQNLDNLLVVEKN